MIDRAETYTRFYRCLVVQHILQHVRNHARTKSFEAGDQCDIAGKPPKKQRTPWQIFLDSLSILCDHENGGETVAAIAVESGFSTGDNATFWIVVNHERPKKSTSVRARDHLLDILQKLQQVTRREKATEELMLDVCDASACKAKDRVNNYRRKLQSVIANLQQRSEELSFEGECPRQALIRGTCS